MNTTDCVYFLSTDWDQLSQGLLSGFKLYNVVFSLQIRKIEFGELCWNLVLVFLLELENWSTYSMDIDREGGIQLTKFHGKDDDFALWGVTVKSVLRQKGLLKNCSG